MREKSADRRGGERISVKAGPGQGDPGCSARSRQFSARGLVSFLFLIAMAVPLIYVSLLPVRFGKGISDGRADLLEVERLKATELEIKNAFRQAISAERHGSIEERRTAVSGDLMELERGLELKYGADAWLGNCGNSEIRGLLAGMAGKAMPLKCAGCADFSEMGVNLKGAAVPLSSAFLFEENGRFLVSKKALPMLPAAYALRFSPHPVCFGVSVYHRASGSAQVVLMREGFG